ATWNFRYGAGEFLRPALIAGFLLSVLFVTSRSMKSSTTTVMPFRPPRRSYSGFGGSPACAAAQKSNGTATAIRRRVADLMLVSSGQILSVRSETLFTPN